ncbi:flagellar motor switch phosphatase FliY [Dethiobacter alkaliphilus]|uniref:flagellar motor switch phosphatase FliY n=1 Tax=Dethiobacter alkaliphilus TaxID=427926 RepID=UPI0022271659|nr:flagellar motor switch phosphatase FliY [Dethiobacter alkaliphilus]MCW3488717.1 flagellar motor switch phosphatase FliY [Dethiobacter alkaliphilus]
MKKLTSLQLDALAENGNIAMGAAATALSNLLGHRVEITTPTLTYTSMGKIREAYPVPCVLARVQYCKGIEGSNMFILSRCDAGVIANMMMGDADLPVPEVLDELYLSAISEAMNQMMGSSATAMSEMLGRLVDITPPDLIYVEDLSAQEEQVGEFAIDSDEVIKVSFDLSIGDYVNSTMLQVLPLEFAENMVTELLGGFAAEIDEKVEKGVKEEAISADEGDTIAEIGNISMGAAATALSTLLDNRVNITTPRISITTLRQVREQYPQPCVVVNVRYRTGLSGENVLIIGEQDAALIAAVMMGEPTDGPLGELDEIRLSAVSEAMNQMMGSSSTALAEMFSREVDITPPVTEYGNPAEEADLTVNIDEPMVQVSFRMEVADILDSDLIQLIPLKFAREMAGVLLGAFAGETDIHEHAQETEPDGEPLLPNVEDVEPVMSTEPQDWLQESSPESALPEEGGLQLDLIRDIPVEITGLLGRRKLPLKELMAAKAGSVVELSCPADAPVDILANGKLVARGEVVHYNERFGIKITEIMQDWKRN